MCEGRDLGWAVMGAVVRKQMCFFEVLESKQNNSFFKVFLASASVKGVSLVCTPCKHPAFRTVIFRNRDVSSFFKNHGAAVHYAHFNSVFFLF